MIKNGKITLGKEQTRMIGNLRVRLGCDLRASFEEQKLPLAGPGLELFINKAGSLAHLVDGVEETLLRVKAVGGAVLDVHPEYAIQKAKRTAHNILTRA